MDKFEMLKNEVRRRVYYWQEKVNETEHGFSKLSYTDYIGEITANSVQEFFSQEQTHDLIKRLKSTKVNMEFPNDSLANIYFNNNVN